MERLIIFENESRLHLHQQYKSNYSKSKTDKFAREPSRFKYIGEEECPLNVVFSKGRCLRSYVISGAVIKYYAGSIVGEKNDNSIIK